MKKLLLSSFLIAYSLDIKAQLLTWIYPSPTETGSAQTLIVLLDASKSNKGLLNDTPANKICTCVSSLNRYLSKRLALAYPKLESATCYYSGYYLLHLRTHGSCKTVPIILEK